MKQTLILGLFAAVLWLSPGEAAAQNSIGANVGYDLDAEEFFVGAQFRLAPASLPIIINPSIETFFIENFTWLHFDLNALYPFGVDNTTFTPYAGAGLGLDYMKPENGDSNTDAGLNLLFGANFGMGRIQPFAEARIRIDGDVGVAVRGGILLGI